MAAILTQVRVDPLDEAFRRSVPTPAPLAVVEAGTIELLPDGGPPVTG